MAQGNPYSSETANAIHDVRDKAADQMERMSNKVEGAVNTLSERGREVGDNVQQIAGNFKSAVDSSVRDQPMATLAIAAAFGFILGAVWKS